MVKLNSFTLILFFFVHGACCMAADQSSAPKNEMSVGAVKDQAEGAAVRLLAKLGDKFSYKEEFVPTMPAPGSAYGTFNLVSREFAVDAADKGKLGNATFRYGIQHYLVGLKKSTDGDGNVFTDTSGNMQIFSAHFGADTDRSLKNRDLLLELGYLPILAKPDRCFSLGFNPLLGVGMQLGKRYRTTNPEYVLTEGNTGGVLKRLKGEGMLAFPLKCVGVKSNGSGNPVILDTLFSDLSEWSLRFRTENWRDFAESKTYHKHTMIIRTPTGVKKDTFVDFRRDIGASPVEFNSGAKYGINLTLGF